MNSGGIAPGVGGITVRDVAPTGPVDSVDRGEKVEVADRVPAAAANQILAAAAADVRRNLHWRRLAATV